MTHDWDKLSFSGGRVISEKPAKTKPCREIKKTEDEKRRGIKVLTWNDLLWIHYTAKSLGKVDHHTHIYFLNIPDLVSLTIASFPLERISIRFQSVAVMISATSTLHTGTNIDTEVSALCRPLMFFHTNIVMLEQVWAPYFHWREMTERHSRQFAASNFVAKLWKSPHVGM